MAGAYPEIDDSIQDSLPLLDEFLKTRAPRTKPLSGVTAVLIQHQLGTQVAQTKALIQLGLDPERIHYLDIPYTANAKVRAALEGLGIPSSHLEASDYRLRDSYATHQRRRVQTLVTRLFDTVDRDDPLLVLDDGCYFVEAMSCFAEPFQNLRVVEQTTRGLIKMQHDSAIAAYASRIPVIDIASSEPKKTWEAPHIGESVCRALHLALGGRIPLEGDDLCLILGYGRIGQEVAKSLNLRLGVDSDRILVSDPDPNAAPQLKEDRFGSWSRSSDEPVTFKLVIGCSGQTSFGVGDRVFLDDGAVLASASSGSAELSREQFIELAESYPYDSIGVKDPEVLDSPEIHRPIELKLVDREVTFLNGGFPVNFDGGVNCVPPEHIQVTRTLMVAAALQALETGAVGVQPIDQDSCAWIDETVAGILQEPARAR